MEMQANNQETSEARIPEGRIPEDMGLWLAIVSQLFTSRVSTVLGDTGLTYTQFSLLNHLGAYQSASIGDIAAAMEINQPGVSKAVRRLDEMGLVSILPDPGDSRRRQISLSSAGVEVLARASEVVAVDGGHWFDGWADGEVSSFRDHLAKLGSWLDANRLA